MSWPTKKIILIWLIFPVGLFALRPSKNVIAKKRIHFCILLVAVVISDGSLDIWKFLKGNMSRIDKKWVQVKFDQAFFPTVLAIFLACLRIFYSFKVRNSVCSTLCNNSNNWIIRIYAKFGKKIWRKVFFSIVIQKPKNPRRDRYLIYHH